MQRMVAVFNMSSKNLLKFVVGGNAKVKPDEGKPKSSIAVFNLPAGHTCPGANLCQARAHADTGEITDGPEQQFRCYAAGDERRFASTRLSRHHNWRVLQEVADLSDNKANAMKHLILASLPPKVERIRVHASGDFFSQAYFNAWMDAAKERPEITFYAYTKSIHFWANRFLDIPDNFHLTASRGGKMDFLIDKFGFKSVTVVYHPDEAAALGLPIDHDDSHAWNSEGSFALLVHGTPKAGSKQSAAQQRMKEEGIEFSYPAQKAQAEREAQLMPV